MSILPLCLLITSSASLPSQASKTSPGGQQMGTGRNSSGYGHSGGPGGCTGDNGGQHLDRRSKSLGLPGPHHRGTGQGRGPVSKANGRTAGKGESTLRPCHRGHQRSHEHHSRGRFFGRQDFGVLCGGSGHSGHGGREIPGSHRCDEWLPG